MSLLSFTVTALLVACAPSGTVPGAKTTDTGGQEVDADADGYAAPDDCNDADPEVHPGATEACNGVDDDCDGGTDEQAADATLWYSDADGDGFGSGDPVASCERTSGYSASASGDCDDADASCWPGAAEACDELDNDCDGSIDEDLSVSTWHADGDGDGYGDPESRAEFCGARDGWGLDATDCDDTNDSVNPGVTEVCGNGVDDDCDADATECRLAGSSPIAAARVELTGVTNSGTAGSSVSGGGDVTGDGIPDLIIGGPEEDAGGSKNGAAFLVAGPAASGSLGAAAASFHGEGDNQWAGWSVSVAGDVNADGMADLLIGAYREPTTGYNAGAAYLISGGGWAGDYDVGDAATSKLLGEAANDNFGYWVSGIGDANADGFDDVAVGAVQESTGAYEAGAVYLFHGPLAGTLSAGSADTKWLGEAAYDYAGLSLAGQGDVDGDGVEDMVVGTYAESSAGPQYGAAYVVDGGTTGILSLSSATAKLTGESPGARAGYAVALLDNDADGYADVIVGAPYEDRGGSLAGAVYVVSGPVVGTVNLAAADAILVGATSCDQAGFAVARAGDLDADGVDDLLVGAPCDPTGGDCAGSVYVVHGPSAGVAVLDGVAARRYGGGPMFWAGWSVSGAGDLDADGYDDFITGVPMANFGTEAVSLGAAYVVAGSGP